MAKSKLKLVFMGSPAFAAEIFERASQAGYAPLAVVTQMPKAAGRGQKLAPTAVETWAKGRGYSVIATENVNSAETLAELESLSPDLLLVVAFGQIFREEILALPKRYCLNLHASLLPKYRGAAPVQYAILNGDKITGVSVQKMVRKLDAGDVLVSRETEIRPLETTGELLARLAPLGGEALTEAIRLVETSTEIFRPQEEGKVSFAPKIEKADAVIDWKKSASQIHDQVRAFQPWPVAETRLGDAFLKVFRTEILTQTEKKPAGTLLSDAKSYLHVVCGDGRLLSLTEIQLENRKRLEIREFLQAFRGSFPYRQVGTVGSNP